MRRQCRRNGCNHPAAATLTLRYSDAQAWLSDLLDDPDPQQWDLCPSHAGSLTVPRGWELVDVRPPEGAARLADEDRRSRAREVRPDGDESGPRRDRYAELHARLPALAAQVAAGSALPMPPRSHVEAAVLPLEAARARVTSSA